MAGTAVAVKRRRVFQERIAPIEVPREFIEILAYQKFERRGSVDGDDKADWFAAETELRRLVRSVEWKLEEYQDPPCLVVTAEGSAQVIKELRRYLDKQPTTLARVEGRDARVRIFCEETPPMPVEKCSPTAEQLERAQMARSPASRLSNEEFRRLKGKLCALLLVGPEKGKVIASVPLDFQEPDKPRKLIKALVAASAYAHQRYQLREILGADSR